MTTTAHPETAVSGHPRHQLVRRGFFTRAGGAALAAGFPATGSGQAPQYSNTPYFASEEEAQTFENELRYILINQLACFNSPVWFNVGTREKPQCSACFILSVQDDMESILDWCRTEGR